MYCCFYVNIIQGITSSQRLKSWGYIWYKPNTVFITFYKQFDTIWIVFDVYFHRIRLQSFCNYTFCIVLYFRYCPLKDLVGVANLYDWFDIFFVWRKILSNVVTNILESFIEKEFKILAIATDFSHKDCQFDFCPRLLDSLWLLYALIVVLVSKFDWFRLPSSISSNVLVLAFVFGSPDIPDLPGCPWL